MRVWIVIVQTLIYYPYKKMENFKSILGLQNAVSVSVEEATRADDISAVLNPYCKCVLSTLLNNP